MVMIQPVISVKIFTYYYPGEKGLGKCFFRYRQGQHHGLSRAKWCREIQLVTFTRRP